ncbi:MAG: hypothetical protein K6E86_06970 [Bacteroidales bacterium]|nr:hypothetical protein [Bacteroidales bacterium]
MIGREQELIVTASANLSKTLGCDDVTTESGAKDCDYILSIAGTSFCVITKGVLTNANLPFALQQASKVQAATRNPVLLVVGYASPAIMQTLYENGISVIDYVGNCMIKHGLLRVNVSGRKNTYRNDTKSNTLSESAIKLIYLFMADKELIGKSYRVISSISGQSLGSIKNTIEELTNRQYVLHTDKGRKLINEDKLLEMWTQAYNQILRPKITLRRMSFRYDEMRSEWQKMQLPAGMSWGGDCGANLTDGYLIPGSFEIYTSQPSALLMTTGMVTPDDHGEITLYQKFWNDASDGTIAPKQIIYADLMNNGDSRQIEAAQKLIKDGI